ncbi:3-hydroxyacyl-CoA dehydrogenase NAD-binding domain-containing protein [Streptomyces sp. NPDC005708]|uniref:3-hydroxyacyl-CoA dehydrogenase NAD-binding domain-containing protein n=1 Tax=Streptomyces sp. NPDC005708 TaxID=3154564 RepID=UPI003408ACFF
MTLIAVVGTGTTGTAIAEACWAAGNDVVLYDADIYAALSAIHRVTAAHRTVTASSGHTAGKNNDRVGRLTFAARLSDLAGSDIIVEAVPERMDLKIAVLRSIEDIIGPDTLLVTSSSSLPLTSMAAQLRDPHRLVSF